MTQTSNQLTSGDFTLENEPFELFRIWMEEAKKAEVNDPNAMALATADKDGLPNVRMVLLKEFDEQGFVFFTNTQSTKGLELKSNPQAAIVLHWKSLQRQVRARGPVTAVSEAEADAYFESRPKDSRIGAWASQQSAPLPHREILENAVAALSERYASHPVPRPPHWSGFRLRPLAIEFWQDRPFRLHDRIVFKRDGDAWQKQRLYP